MNFNERITKVIEYSQMVPADFAEEIGVQRSSISHIVSGRNKPSLDFIIKIKNQFPEIEWDWLINGQGEMLAKNESPSQDSESIKQDNEKKQTNQIPDLFSLLADDKNNQIENEKYNLRDSEIAAHHETTQKISDSQRLGSNTQNPLIQKKEIKRIVFFYKDGTFETYEN